MRFHRLHAHDVGDLASVAGFVILRSGYERVHVLADAGASAMGRRDLLVVSVPDNFRLRISAAWSTGELYVLTALHGFTLGIALYVRWTGWICEADALCDVAPLYRGVTLTKLIWKHNPDNWDRKSVLARITQRDAHARFEKSSVNASNLHRILILYIRRIAIHSIILHNKFNLTCYINFSIN